jgi:hypothetical protein
MPRSEPRAPRTRPPGGSVRYSRRFGGSARRRPVRRSHNGERAPPGKPAHRVLGTQEEPSDPLLPARLGTTQRLGDLRRLRCRWANGRSPERPGLAWSRARGVHVASRRQTLERHRREQRSGRRLRKNGRDTGSDLDPNDLRARIRVGIEDRDCPEGQPRVLIVRLDPLLTSRGLEVDYLLDGSNRVCASGEHEFICDWNVSAKCHFVTSLCDLDSQN